MDTSLFSLPLVERSGFQRAQVLHLSPGYPWQTRFSAARTSRKLGLRSHLMLKRPIKLYS